MRTALFTFRNQHVLATFRTYLLANNTFFRANVPLLGTDLAFLHFNKELFLLFFLLLFDLSQLILHSEVFDLLLDIFIVVHVPLRVPGHIENRNELRIDEALEVEFHFGFDR